MKTLNSLKKFGLAMVALTLMLTAANAQQRYKHMPRVKIEKKTTEVAPVQENTSINTTTAQLDNSAELNVTNSEHTTVASNNEEVVVADKAPTNVTDKVKQKKIKKSGTKKPMFIDPGKFFRDAFAKEMEKQTKLFKATENKKAMMAKWKLLMIIFFCVGGALILLAIILTIVFVASAGYGYYGGLGFWYLWLLGGLCITAGAVFLILGLTGVMS